MLEPLLSSARVVTVLEAVQTSLTSGSNVLGVAILTAISALVVTPLTLIRPIHSIAIGYGTSVAVMSLALIVSFHVPSVHTSRSAPDLLVHASLLYGIRLTAHIVLRNLTVKSIEKQGKLMDGMSRLNCILLSGGVSVLYAFMVSPVFFALRQASEEEQQHTMDHPFLLLPEEGLTLLQWMGVILAYSGLVLETVADLHKYIVKRIQFDAEFNGCKFVGPTSGTYALCRHPNYFGEVIFWVGLYMGGVVGFGRSWTAWICATCGKFSIVYLMFGATDRLEKKQENYYGGQPHFEEWKKNVKSPLIPFVSAH